MYPFCTATRTDPERTAVLAGRVLDRTRDAHSWADNGTVPPWKRKGFDMDKDTSRLLLQGAVRDPLNLNDAFNAADH
eukprot:1966155-Rhodomonas_salina.1